MDLRDIKKAFAGRVKAAFLGNSANYGIGPDLFLDSYHYVVMDYSPLVDALRQEGRSVFCLEEALGTNAVFRSTSNLIEREEAVAFMRGKGISHLTVFKNSSKVEAAAVRHGWRMAASAASISQALENKFNLSGIAAQAGVDACLSTVFDPNDPEQTRMALKAVGLPCVVQAARGFAGTKTFLVEDPSDLVRITGAMPAKALKAAGYQSGSPMTVNACVTGNGIVAGRPVFQITGMAECTANPLGSCGNDFGFGVPYDPSEIRRLVERVGVVLRDKGFRGVFGLDFVVAGDKMVVIEINPRITASLPLHTAVQLELGETPLMALHLAEFTDAKLNPEIRPSDDGRAGASSIIVYNTSPEPVVVKGAARAGVYALEGGEAVFLRPGVRLSDCASADEFLLSPAAQDRVVNPGIEMARIYFKRGVMKAADAFHDDIAVLVASVKRSLLRQEERAAERPDL
ncbi:MAG: ATP-grasp domain-containing protein [Candidatus Aquicultorales bacterium]